MPWCFGLPHTICPHPMQIGCNYEITVRTKIFREDTQCFSIFGKWLRPDSSPDPSLRATLHRPFKSSANSQTSPSPKSVISSGISPAVCVLLHTPLAPANAARFARGIPSRAPVGSSDTELSRHASKNLPPDLYKCGGKSISQ